jgi:hypothetical protein
MPMEIYETIKSRPSLVPLPAASFVRKLSWEGGTKDGQTDLIESSGDST